MIGVIDCAGPRKNEDASIGALHSQHPRTAPNCGGSYAHCRSKQICAVDKCGKLESLGKRWNCGASLLSIIQIRTFGPCAGQFKRVSSPSF